MTVTDPPPLPDDKPVTTGSQGALEPFVNAIAGLFSILGGPIKGLYQAIGSAYATAATVLGLFWLGSVFVYVENMPEPLADPNADVHRARSEEGLKADRYRSKEAYERWVSVYFANEEKRQALGIEKPEE